VKVPLRAVTRRLIGTADPLGEANRKAPAKDPFLAHRCSSAGGPRCADVLVKESSSARRPDVTAVELVGGTEPLELELHSSDEQWVGLYLDHRRQILNALVVANPNWRWSKPALGLRR
jgi:hypothetical protein